MDATTGQIIQDSLVTVSDAGDISNVKALAINRLPLSGAGCWRERPPPLSGSLNRMSKREAKLLPVGGAMRSGKGKAR